MKPFNGPSLDTQPPGVEAGQQGRPGRGAFWADVGFREPDTVSAQLLHPRCLEIRVVPRDLVIISGSARKCELCLYHLVPTKVVRQDEDDMGRTFVASLNRVPFPAFALLSFSLVRA